MTEQEQEPYDGHNQLTPVEHVEYLAENPGIFGFTDEEQKALVHMLAAFRANPLFSVLERVRELEKENAKLKELVKAGG